MTTSPTIEYLPLTPDRWQDFETLFGPNGAAGGCWCMHWRLPRKEFVAGQGDGNRQAMHTIVESEKVPGLLAYVDGQIAGWCSVGPREDFPRLEKSKVAKRVDEQAVWSIVCLFIGKKYRNQGVSVGLVKAATDYAVAQGAKIVEAYPVEPQHDKMPDVFAWTGIASAYLQAGYVEVTRHTAGRPFMRFYAK